MVSLKLPPTIGRARLENTKGNPFFTFVKTDQNTQFFFRILGKDKRGGGGQKVRNWVPRFLTFCNSVLVCLIQRNVIFSTFGDLDRT